MYPYFLMGTFFSKYSVFKDKVLNSNHLFTIAIIGYILCLMYQNEIPVNLKYTIGLGSMAGVYFAAGPDFFFNLKDFDVEGGKAKKSQVAVNIGAGLKLLSKLQLGVTYQIPMGDSFEWKDAVGAGSAKNKTWHVSAAYMF
mgnify:CR=1 FL=1